MTDSLFPQLDPESAQWRLTRLQVCNWGGYHGYHDVPFGTGTTLITGESGSGKSTLLDAYIAVMMPTSVPFNGASNEGGGRARGSEQRNLLTYIRGKKDTGHGGGDTVLRGDGTATWGAVASTYTSTAGQVFTALKICYVPANARVNADLKLTHATMDGPLDLAGLDACRDAQFSRQSVKAQYPGIHTYGLPGEYLAAVYTRLGIGAGGDGARAVQLLARVQSGRTVRSVDALYREMVLEEPRTYASATKLIQHVEAQQANLDAIAQAQAQLDTLQDLPELYARYEAAVAEKTQLDRLKVGDPSGPLAHWLNQRERELCAGALADAQRRAEVLTRKHEEAIARERELQGELEELQAALAGQGDSLTAAVRSVEARHADVRRAAADFARRTPALEAQPTTSDEFDALQSEARTFLSGAGAHRDQLEAAKQGIQAERFPLLEELKAKREELRSLRQRDDCVPRAYADARDGIARLVGLAPADLPFAAELIDVADEEWRTAAEATLRGVGLTMLMDQSHQPRIRKAIDGLDLGVRIKFEGVDTGQPAPADAPGDGMLSSHLLYKPGSRFSAWARTRTQRDDVDHLCVDSPADLGGPVPQVTRSGQTSRGVRGAHGRARGQRHILGFSNGALKGRLIDEIGDLNARISETDKELAAADNALRRHDSQCATFREVENASWSDIDVPSAAARVAEAKAALDVFMNGDSERAALMRRKDAARDAWSQAVGEVTRIGDTKSATGREVAQLKGALQDLDAALTGPGEVSEQDAQMLEDQFYSESVEVDHASFPSLRSQFEQRLRSQLRDKQPAIAYARGAVERVFDTFNRSWPDPSRGGGIEFFPEFLELYEQLQEDQTGAALEGWRRMYAEEVGVALVDLAQAYSDSRAEIDSRLEPINSVLAGLPFGAESHRLRITIHDRPHAEYVQFLRQVRELGSHHDDTSQEAIEARFAQLRDMMGQISEEAGALRDWVLDVRRQIHIKAEALDEDGNVVSEYDSLGGKSGGETQELIAFIIGAALRYQLGDESSSHPRFAPVILDEGFIKADARFAGRAIRAWQALGFQLTVGTPVDKTTGLEPRCDHFLIVHKDSHGRSTVVPVAREEEGVPLAEDAA